MTATWTVLASGSSGNASLLEMNGTSLLVDLGLGPRQLDQRLAAIGCGWDAIRGALLTHTHSDHWNPRSLTRLAERRIPLYCHAGHLRTLQLGCRAFQDMQFAGLAKTYTVGRPFSPLTEVNCRAVELKHDGGPTFGFRIESLAAPDQRANGAWSVGYAADLGTWDASVSRALADVDLLALEFNHDVEMQLASRRARWLINRVLSDFGHLSNVQAARLLEDSIRKSPNGRLRHVVQLHLSRECNQPGLAASAAREVLSQFDWNVEVHTAQQDAPGRRISLRRPEHSSVDRQAADQSAVLTLDANSPAA